MLLCCACGLMPVARGTDERSAMNHTVSQWLHDSFRGTCGKTYDVGDCMVGDKGAWVLPVHTWRPAIAWCLAKCTTCPRCAHVSISLQYRDCSWYARCPIQSQFRFSDFQSGSRAELAAQSAASVLAMRCATCLRHAYFLPIKPHVVPCCACLLCS